jgi:hypothetical protein
MFVLLSTALILSIFRSRVTLRVDRIELRGLVKTRTLLRDDILGRRLVRPHNSPPILVLVPRNVSQKQMKIGLIYNFDAAFQDWTAFLPDLDEQDLRANRQEIMSNPALGITPNDRTDALQRAQRFSRFLMALTFVAGAWAWIDPRPYRLVISLLGLLPWVAVVITARSAGLFRIDQKPNDPHPSVAIPFLLPGAVLMLRVIHDMNSVEWIGPFCLSIALAGFLTAAAIMSDRSLRSRVITGLLIFVFSMSYGYGAGMEANALLDRSAASVYAVRVTDKRESSGRSTTFYLNLAPWGPMHKGNKVSVSPRFYRSVKAGDTVCVALRPGALHLPWYIVSACN